MFARSRERESKVCGSNHRPHSRVQQTFPKLWAQFIDLRIGHKDLPNIDTFDWTRTLELGQELNRARIERDSLDLGRNFRRQVLKSAQH